MFQSRNLCYNNRKATYTLEYHKEELRCAKILTKALDLSSAGLYSSRIRCERYPNAMNAAWGGISEDKELSMCISEDHKTTANILTRKAFTVSMATAEQAVACDYVGIESGNKVADKVAKAGWHTTKSEFVDAPLIDKLPMAVECRLVSYNPESCRLMGEIVNVSADESVLDETGKIDPDKLRPITFDPIHNTYHVLGEK